MRNFSEKQRFRQWWIWMILIVAALLPVIVSLVQWFRGAKLQSLIGGTVVSLILAGLFVLLFRVLQLRTTVDDSGVSYQFYPLHLRPVKIAWEELDRVYITQYNPLRDYGGWGVRYSLRKGKGMAYNIAGDMGLQMIFKSGRKILIGTQHPVALTDTLVDLKREGNIILEITAPS